MKLILSSQAKKMEEGWQQDDQGNIYIRVRQKWEFGCIIRGFIVFSLHQMHFAVMGLTNMTKGGNKYAVIR
jgi:hypothetical protein